LCLAHFHSTSNTSGLSCSIISSTGIVAMKLFSQTFEYGDPWPIVSLAFFLRYPNPYASHVISCDVISRKFSPTGSLLTKRLILKRGAIPKWFPVGIISRAESWVIEESEVDLEGKTVRCSSCNLDNVKVLRVIESVTLRSSAQNTTLQTTQAEIISRFGWGLKNPIESHALARLKANIERSRQGVSLVLDTLRESRVVTFQPMIMGPSSYGSRLQALRAARSENDDNEQISQSSTISSESRLSKLKRWFGKDG